MLREKVWPNCGWSAASAAGITMQQQSKLNDDRTMAAILAGQMLQVADRRQ
jgi:hypothetical protein